MCITNYKDWSFLFVLNLCRVVLLFGKVCESFLLGYSSSVKVAKNFLLGKFSFGMFALHLDLG